MSKNRSRKSSGASSRKRSVSVARSSPPLKSSSAKPRRTAMEGPRERHPGEGRDPLKISRGQRRKHLDERLQALHHRAMMIERELLDLDDDRFYRTCIFGSARIKADTPAYKQAFTLARCLAWEGIDILTGGGPGLMEAANKGAKLGRSEKRSKSLSFGLSIQLEWEPTPNSHLDVKRHHQKFSSRLDDFMRLSHSIVVTPGGIGTVLELFFAWQLIQVKHLPPRPIVLMDRKFWTPLIIWMKELPLARGLVGAKDFDCLAIVDTPEEVLDIISKHHREFLTKRKGARGGKTPAR